MRYFILLACFGMLCLGLHAQGVTIGSNNPPDPAAVLDLQSNSKGFMLPRLTTLQRNAIQNPPEGLMIFNTDNKCVESWFLTGWKSIECECTTPPTQPGAIVAPAQVCPGQDSIWLSVPLVSSATQYQWTIDNQDTLVTGQGTDSILVHFSGQAGSRSISVLATNGCGSSSASNATLNVQWLDSTFTVTPNSPIINNAAQFSANQSGATYAWTFQSGTPASSVAQNPQVTWTQIGNYQVQLSVSDNLGCTVNRTQQVTVTNCQPATFTFTNCGQTGRTGPSQSQCNSSYGPGVVTVVNGIQEWTVPPNISTIEIEAWGAQGGTSTVYNNAGGRGAYVKGTFQVTPGQVLRILVGQQGANNNTAPSGGGGSFVATSNNTPLIVAGGGGGAGSYYDANFANAKLSDPANRGYNPGRPGTTNGEAPGGNNGNGGSAGRLTPGGGGFYANGATTNADGGSSIPGPGQAFVNGGAGGTPANTTTCSGSSFSPAPGGFGGGAGAAYAAAAPGGGYSGGGGTDGCNPGTGGGGSSFNSGTNQTGTAGQRTGHGQVVITTVCP